MGAAFRAARNYHRALASYARTLRAGGDIEDAAQHIVGASLQYRAALERLLEHGELTPGDRLANRSRLERLRRMLCSASQQYNVIKNTPQRAAPG